MYYTREMLFQNISCLRLITFETPNLSATSISKHFMFTVNVREDFSNYAELKFQNISCLRLIFEDLYKKEVAKKFQNISCLRLILKLKIELFHCLLDFKTFHVYG